MYTDCVECGAQTGGPLICDQCEIEHLDQENQYLVRVIDEVELALSGHKNDEWDRTGRQVAELHTGLQEVEWALAGQWDDNWCDLARAVAKLVKK